uniref:Uncharacterized protein n=1 Tax=Solanum tuberosum TaxID=4113 RepID=M1A7P6_SOLTU
MFDIGDDRMPEASEMLREWKRAVRMNKGTIAANRFNAGYDETYKTWLKGSRQGISFSVPNIYRSVEDKESKALIELREASASHDTKQEEQIRGGAIRNILADFTPAKGKIAAKMEKCKNVEVKTIEESLRMKLRRFKQEIREMGERRIEVELATAVVQAKRAALDAELVANMAKYAIMKEETVAMQKEHDVFNNDITMRLQKLHGKYSSTTRPLAVVPKALYLNLLKRNLRRKLSIGLVSRDCGKKGMRKSPLKHTGPINSFPSESSQKGKAAMSDNNEEPDLTDVVVAQPALADQNKLILKLMQQIAEMRVEMQRKQDLPPSIFAVNAQPDGRPPAQIPSPNVEQAQNLPSSP